MRFGSICLLTFVVSLIAAPAFAQDKDLVPDAVKKGDKKTDGWDTTLSIGATINMVDNRSVVGQNEGSTWTLGGTLKGDTKYKKGKFEFRSALSINENFTRSPIIPEFLNTADSAVIDGNVYYSFLSWMGLFARVEMGTNLFNNYFATVDDTVFSIKRSDQTEVTEARDRLRLKDPLGLIILKESAGVFARPYSKKHLDLEVRLGAGAREIFATKQIVIKDDKATADIIEAEELVNFTQVGAEIALAAKGSIVKNRVAYKSSVEALFPFYNSIDTGDKNILDLTNVDWTTQISFKLVEWASLDYQLKMVRQPLILEDWQVQNSLLLTFGYTLIDDVEKK